MRGCSSYVLPPNNKLVLNMIWLSYTDIFYIKMMGCPQKIDWNRAWTHNPFQLWLSPPKLIFIRWTLLMALWRLLEETNTSLSFTNWWRWQPFGSRTECQICKESGGNPWSKQLSLRKSKHGPWWWVFEDYWKKPAHRIHSQTDGDDPATYTHSFFSEGFYSNKQTFFWAYPNW